MPATPPPPAAVSPHAPPPPLAPIAAHSSRRGPWIIVAFVLLLLILHQDNWFWTDGRLVFGFMPIGLLWHAGLSVAAMLTWLLATKIAWPVEPELDAAIAQLSDSPVHAVEREGVQ